MQTTIPRTQLILGGQKSGKSRFAETIAADWLGQSVEHEVLFIATAQAAKCAKELSVTSLIEKEIYRK